MRSEWPCDHCPVLSANSCTSRYAGGLEGGVQRFHRVLRDGEVQIVYQPVLDLVDGSIAAVGALLSWNDALQDEHFPTEVLGIAEQGGAIVPTGIWLLDRALADFSSWRAMSLGINRISVSVSGVELESPSFLQAVQDILRRHRQEPQHLTLEVRESYAMCGCPFTSELMIKLAEMGVELSLEDFGSGQSSLCRLRQVPVREMKIDSRMITSIEDDPQCMRLVSAVVELGNAMELRVVAKGVETLVQQALLAECGCHAIQGPRVGGPSSPGEIELLARFHAQRQQAIEGLLRR